MQENQRQREGRSKPTGKEVHEGFVRQGMRVRVIQSSRQKLRQNLKKVLLFCFKAMQENQRQREGRSKPTGKEVHEGFVRQGMRVRVIQSSRQKLKQNLKKVLLFLF